MIYTENIYNAVIYSCLEKFTMQEYIDFAKNFVKEAGVIARKYFNNSETQRKSDLTPVTQADTEINSLLIEKVKSLFPDHKVMGEEESMDGSSEWCWVCDPIDGTAPYTMGIPIFSICLALLHNSESVLGIIYDPILDKMFRSDGEKSYMNDQQIHVNQESDVKKCMVAIENLIMHKGELSFSDLYAALREESIKEVQFLSIAYPTALVGAGKLGATIFPAHHIWEYAAAKPIIECAGGKVTNLKGEKVDFRNPGPGYIASNGVIHDFLLDIIKKTVKLD